MVRVHHVVNLAQGERIVKRYHVARKPAFPEINRYLTVTNQRIILETRVESALYGMELYDEAHLDVIRGTTVGYEKRYDLGKIIAGIFLILWGLGGMVMMLSPPRPNYYAGGYEGYSSAPDPMALICMATGIPLLFVGIALLLYSKHEAFYLKLKIQHIGDIDFGVLKKGLALLSLKPGPDADAAIIELGALVKTLQKNPNFSFSTPTNIQTNPSMYGNQYPDNERPPMY